MVVAEAFAELPIISGERTEFIEGEATPRLILHKKNARITVPAPVIQLSETPFDVG